MQASILSVILVFLEGLGVILSPCILPILPIVLAVSLAGSKRRPIGVVLGFIVSFASLAFFARQVVTILGIDVTILRTISYGVLLLLAMLMLSTRLMAFWERCLLRCQLPQMSMLQQDGFWSGLLLGGIISLIWVPCAGPILAAVIVQTVIQKAGWYSFLMLLAFAAGTAVPMLLIILYGRTLLKHMRFLNSNSLLIRRGLGLLLLASVLWMLWRDHNPQQVAVVQSVARANALQEGVLVPYPAPSLVGISAWINTALPQTTLPQGRVVLVDFWTYSCINCLRTIPYLNGFYAQYHPHGLDIIGIHSPEFAFEKDRNRVAHFVKKNAIEYPVALDNDFMTWQAFNNHYWPAQYLIDKTGNVVYAHFGEGKEAVLDNNIRYLLGYKQSTAATETYPSHNAITITPEIYLGYERSVPNYRPKDYLPERDATYQLPSALLLDAWALAGSWRILSDHIVSLRSESLLKVHFKARALYLVMGAERQAPVALTIDYNGKRLTRFPGQDSHGGQLIVGEHTIYPILALNRVTEGTLTIHTGPQLAIYTITFGP